jgi:hypothetical protein
MGSKVYVLNAGGAHIDEKLLDILYLNDSVFSGPPLFDFIGQVRYRSHPLQTELFASPGGKVRESQASGA